MPLPSVVVMTVPRSPATLSRLLRVGSGRAKPARPRLRQRLGRPAPPTAARLRFGASRAARPSAGMEMCSDTGGGERSSVGEGQDGPRSCRGASSPSSLFPPYSHLFSFFIFLFFLPSLSFCLSFPCPLISSPIPSPPLPFPLPFPFPRLYFFLFPHCHGPMSLCLVPAGLFEHSLSAFTANPFPKSSPSIA